MQILLTMTCWKSVKTWTIQVSGIFQQFGNFDGLQVALCYSIYHQLPNYSTILVKWNQHKAKDTTINKDEDNLLNWHLMKFAPSNCDTWVHVIDLRSPQCHCLKIILDSHVKPHLFYLLPGCSNLLLQPVTSIMSNYFLQHRKNDPSN